jgi:ABC-type glycerol-3-phosphate transport system substrate-binding protein
MRGRAVVLAAAIVMAPLGAQAADFVVWWDEGYYPEEDEAVRESIAAFEQDTGQVELVFLGIRPTDLARILGIRTAQAPAQSATKQ